MDTLVNIWIISLASSTFLNTKSESEFKLLFNDKLTEEWEGKSKREKEERRNRRLPQNPFSISLVTHILESRKTQRQISSLVIYH